MATDERNHLKAWREKRGLSQEELAEKAGTTKSVISLLENEKRPLSAKWLRKFAEALNTKPGYILDHDPNELNDDVFDIWDRIAAGDRSQAVRVLSTFAKTGTKG
jgi:transcriptional regulator with XRE-family HTH domain